MRLDGLVGRVSASSVGSLVFKPPVGLYLRLEKNCSGRCLLGTQYELRITKHELRITKHNWLAW